MTAAVAHSADTHPPVTHDATATRPALRLVVRPAPFREPPFDDEVADTALRVGRYDQRLPFVRPSMVADEPLRSLRRHGLPDPASWSRRLLLGLIETADGRRPLHQVAAMLSPSIGRGLSADFDRAAVTGTGHWLHRATVLSVRAGEPTEGVAELCATLEVGPRVRAVALRLETRRGRWQCTRLQLG